MAGPDKGFDLINAMIRGGEKAVSEFGYISGGEWFDEAPEYFLTTYVASSVSSSSSTHSLLEVSINKSRKRAGAFRRGRPANHERRNGRFDIVVYWAKDTPRGAVEIKSPIWSVTRKLIKPDIDELCSALTARKESTFQFGAFIYYASVSDPKRIHNNASQRLRDLLIRMDNLAIELANDHGVDCLSKHGTIHRGENGIGGAWSIAALVFTHKGRLQSFQSRKSKRISATT